MQRKVQVLLLQFQHKNSFSYCQPYYSALFKDHQYLIPGILQLRHGHMLMTPGGGIDFSKDSVLNFFCWNLADVKSRVRKCLRTCTFSSNISKSISSNRIVYHELNDNSDKRNILVNKINDILVHPSPSDSAKQSKSSSMSALLYAETMEEATIERKILYFMHSWELNAAIGLLKDSVADGANPDRTVIFHLLLRIAELGWVEKLMEHYETFLKEKKLISNERFYHCLGVAILRSGHVKKGMDILMQRHKAGMGSGDTDILFSVLTTLILKEYEHYYYLVEKFVDTVLTGNPPLIPVKALLWKCCVLAQKFDKADELRSNHETLKKLIPAQASSIVHSSSWTYIDFDREAVLQWLIQQPYLKEGLRASAVHMLVQQQCEQKDWGKVFKYLILAMNSNVKPQQVTLINFLTVFFDECSDEAQFVFWKIVGEHLESNEAKKGTSKINDGDSTNSR